MTGVRVDGVVDAVGVVSLRAVRLLVALLVVAAVTACSSSGGNAPAPAGTKTPGKYDQTWTKSYSTTTCADWNAQMDSHQRFVMAADMLLAGRKDDGASELPPDSMIQLFVTSIGTVCEPDASGVIKVGEVAASLYTLSSDFKP